MKKFLLWFFLFFISTTCVIAKEIEVEFASCVDGDTAKFIYNGEVIKARFLAIDTPETVHPTKGKEKWGKEASEYTCNKISNATKIILEFDSNSDEMDKYDRYLVWIFVDNLLLQKQLIDLGYAKVAYLYGDYKYTEILKDSEKMAKEKKLGIWSENNTTVDKIDYYIIILFIIMLFICIFSTKKRKKIINKAKNNIEKKIKKELINKR